MVLYFDLYSKETNHWETIIYASDTWSYFPGSSDPGSSWKNIDFDDSGWQKGAGGIGFGDNDDVTVISNVPSLFLRIKFNISDTSKINELVFNIDYDDGFIAYINSSEIARAGLSGNPVLYTDFADNHEAVMKDGGLPDIYKVDKNILKNGENILTIEIHNGSATSSDMSAIPFLSAGITDENITYRVVPEWFQEPFDFKESNIPIVIIETKNNATIVDEPKTDANMKIINTGKRINKITDSANIYNGNIGIEIRGSYSASLPQKPYGIETRDNLGNNNNVSLLGMPEENDWILLANYNDKSFIRNTLVFHLFNMMGHYAARTEWCEVMLNGNYDGIYVFTEKLKRDKNRINIAKLDTSDKSGDDLTGGYVFKIDYYNSNGSDNWVSNYSPIDKPGAIVHFVYHDPKPEELLDVQKQYIKDYVDDFETILYSQDFNNLQNGYFKYIDLSSFVDYFIIGEFSRNADAYKKSRYFYKDKNSKGGQIYSGPVWDFDWALKNMPDGCNIFNNTDGSGWAYLVNSASCNINPIPTSWMVRLMQDTTFSNTLGYRYHTLRKTILSNEYIHHYIDSATLLLNEAQVRHYTRWPILGIRSGAAEVDGYPDSFEGEVEKLKTWIDVRLEWLDKNMPALKSKPVVGINENISFNFKTFPNPTHDYFWIESDKELKQLDIYNISGIKVMSINEIYRYVKTINIVSLKRGIYLIKITDINGTSVNSRLIVN